MGVGGFLEQEIEKARKEGCQYVESDVVIKSVKQRISDFGEEDGVDLRSTESKECFR